MSHEEQEETFMDEDDIEMAESDDEIEEDDEDAGEMVDEAPAPPPEPVEEDAAMQRRRSIQAIMRDTTLSETDKRMRIQAIMRYVRVQHWIQYLERKLTRNPTVEIAPKLPLLLLQSYPLRRQMRPVCTMNATATLLHRAATVYLAAAFVTMNWVPQVILPWTDF